MASDDLITWLRAQLDEREEHLRYGLEHGEQMYGIDHDLADIDAKRRILDLHLPSGSWPPGSPTCITCGMIPGPWVPYPCQTLRLLAMPYDARGGYRDEWRP